nr:MAG TPA: hypothetical protein [Bacteriophage sp.]
MPPSQRLINIKNICKPYCRRSSTSNFFDFFTHV